MKEKFLASMRLFDNSDCTEVFVSGISQSNACQLLKKHGYTGFKTSVVENGNIRIYRSDDQYAQTRNAIKTVDVGGEIELPMQTIKQVNYIHAYAAKIGVKLTKKRIGERKRNKGSVGIFVRIE